MLGGAVRKPTQQRSYQPLNTRERKRDKLRERERERESGERKIESERARERERERERDERTGSSISVLAPLEKGDFLFNSPPRHSTTPQTHAMQPPWSESLNRLNRLSACAQTHIHTHTHTHTHTHDTVREPFDSDHMIKKERQRE
jgi:hypothetical protein